MRGVGPSDARIMLVGEAAGAHEDARGVPFVGEAGKLLNMIIEDIGWDRSSLFLTNTCRCRPTNNRTPKAAEIEACLPFLEEEISRIKPRVIIALGGTPLKALLNQRRILSARGNPQWSAEYNAHVFPTVHPAFVLRNPNYFDVLKRDLESADVLLRTGRIGDCSDITVKHIDRLDDAINYLESLLSVKEFALDIETYGKDPWKSKGLCSMAFALSAVDACGIDIRLWSHDESGKLFSKLKCVLESSERLKIIHNYQFEYKMLRKICGIGIAPPVYDTIVAHHLCHEEYPHDLDSLATLHCNMPNYKNAFGALTKNYANMDAPTTAQLLNYNGYDAVAAFRLRCVLDGWMVKEKVVHLFWGLSMPLAHTLAHVVYTGVHVDTDRMRELATGYKKRIDVGTQAARILAGNSDFNPASPKELAAYLYENKGYAPLKKSSKTGAASTDEASLDYLDDKYNDPMVRIVKAIRKSSKLRGTYLVGDTDDSGLMQHVDKDGRIHADYLLHGTTTGRISSRGPNLQNIPRESEIRSVFTASQGYYLVDADYSQIELRVLAFYSRDPVFLSIFRAGKDPHSSVAVECFGADLNNVVKDLRDAAKIVNFGIVYGMGPESLAVLISKKRGRYCSIEEADEYRRAYLVKFAAVDRFMERVRSTALQGKELVTIFGRKKRFPFLEQWLADRYRYSQELGNALRSAQNFLIQSTAGDILSEATVRLDKRLKRTCLDARIVLTVHDELVTEFRNTYDRDEAAAIVRSEMENPLRFGSALPFPVEVECVNAWKQKLEV